MSTAKLPNIEFIGTGSSSTGNQMRFNDATRQYEVFHNGFWFVKQGSYYSISGKTRAAYGPNGSAAQTFTVPAGVTSIYVKMWGAGGGGGGFGSWTHGDEGGAGGHSRGIIPVTPGQVLYLAVGTGGFHTPGGAGGGGWPNGGNHGNVSYCAGGGGLTGIFRDALSKGFELMIAGGGGGGGSTQSGYNMNNGGAGGGLQGQDGNCMQNQALRGQGGTQFINGLSNSPVTSVTGFSGQQNTTYGAGGGAGYWGGGAGNYAEPNAMGGGGGGSGYLHPSVVMGETFRGTGRIPYAFDDPDLTGTVVDDNSTAHGGAGLRTNGGGNVGGPGYIVIYY